MSDDVTEVWLRTSRGWVPLLAAWIAIAEGFRRQIVPEDCVVDR